MSADLRKVEMVIRGCPFSVDVSISKVAEGAREGFFNTRASELAVNRSDGGMAESNTKSRDFKPSMGGMAS